MSEHPQTRTDTELLVKIVDRLDSLIESSTPRGRSDTELLVKIVDRLDSLIEGSGVPRRLTVGDGVRLAVGALFVAIVVWALVATVLVGVFGVSLFGLAQ
jgi:hypothetical protein